MNNYISHNLNLPLSELMGWLAKAGQIARTFQGVIEPQCKPNQSFITQADIEIEQFLLAQLRTAYPCHTVVAEETAYETSTFSPYVWAIDPLDGTTAFVFGLPDWGIILGLLYQWQPVFGAIYFPALDELLVTLNGKPCISKMAQPDLKDVKGPALKWSHKSFLAVSSASVHQKFNIQLPRVRTVGSIGAGLAHIARGTATAAFLPKAHLWDLVAGAAILNRAGAELRYLSGEPVNFEALANGDLAPEPILAGHPLIVARLLSQGTIQKK
jgi:myo-inositol-1(or 4)-monophosphatase